MGPFHYAVRIEGEFFAYFVVQKVVTSNRCWASWSVYYFVPEIPQIFPKKQCFIKNCNYPLVGGLFRTNTEVVLSLSLFQFWAPYLLYIEKWSLSLDRNKLTCIDQNKM